MDQSALRNYLATGNEPVTEAVIVLEGKHAPSPVAMVITNLMAVGMLAKDLHYRARGRPFYAIHLLSDLVWQVRQEVDELIEVYYLGECKTVPPMMYEFEAAAARVAREAVGRANGTMQQSLSAEEAQLLQALPNRCEAVAGWVENCKALALRSGTNAVLDEISKKALQNIGLLGRTDTFAPTVPTDVAPATGA